ncbi:MAG TPA: phytanoyl-CoA dioxygenase family protein [Chlamydiales bacterium]|nr:phytanoyl-CoA dioxygenase family protein [Chlamydiales bacterium]
MDSSVVLKMSPLKREFDEKGFATKAFPQEIRNLMLAHIEEHIRKLGTEFVKSNSLEEIAQTIPDSVWSKEMTRAFRVFPKELAEKIHAWADQNIRVEFDRARSAVNVVYPQECEVNKSLTLKDIAIYWRCVRPGKPDAGRPHRDASFWVLEFEEGYDPKIPFPFNYLKDCIKIWIPLKGCTPNATLQVIPHSHQMEIPTVVEQTEYGRRPSISSAWLKENEKNFMSPIELSKGSCIIFDMNLVHRGPTHNNDELRISAELCFILGS